MFAGTAAGTDPDAPAGAANARAPGREDSTIGFARAAASTDREDDACAGAGKGCTRDLVREGSTLPPLGTTLAGGL